MEYSKSDLEWAASQGLLNEEQLASLLQALEQRGSAKPKFDFMHVAYYFGAVVVISAMGWFVNEAWDRLSGLGVFTIACVYAAVFLIGGRYLWNRAFRVPGGLLITLAVWMTPLGVYGLEKQFGIWPQGYPGSFPDYHVWIKGSWLIMEVATIVTGLLALRSFRFTFLTFPVAFSLWYLSMDLTPLLFGKQEFVWDEQLWVSLWFGLFMLVIAYFVDRRTREDFAFWLYLLGMLAFWGGLSLMKSESELNKFIYCMINVFLIFVSVWFGRRIFIICGTLGVFGYLAHLADSIFKDSLLFPFVLSAIGIAIIACAFLYHRNQQTFQPKLLRLWPEWLLQASPTRRN